MRLEEWFKRVELYDRTTEEKAADKPAQNTNRQPPPNRRATPVEPQDPYRPRTPGSDRNPTVVSNPAPESLPAVTKGRTSDAPTFRTASAPGAQRPLGGGSANASAPKATRTPKARRDGSLSTQKETREQLLGRLLDPVLTLEEAAQVLKVCPTTVRRYTNKNLLEHYRTTGNQRRFRLSHVLNFLGETGGSLETGTVSAEPEVQEQPKPTLRKRKARNLGGSFSSRPTTR